MAGHISHNSFVTIGHRWPVTKVTTGHKKNLCSEKKELHVQNLLFFFFVVLMPYRANVRKTALYPKRAGWKSSRGVMVRDARRTSQSRPYPARAGELKFVDRAFSQDINTGTTLELLNGTTRGSDADGNRIGRNITLKSVEWRLSITSEANNASAGPIRFLLVWDKDPNGTIPANADIIVATSTTSLQNMGNQSRFVILRDYLISTGAGVVGGAAASAGSQCIPLKGYVKLNHKVTYNTGTAGTIADIQHGALYALLLSDLAAGASDWDATGNFRVRYTDL